MNCLTCGGEIPPSAHRDKRYCSFKCSSQPKRPGYCDVCGKPVPETVPPARRQRKYCSKGCANVQNHRERNDRKRNPAGVIPDCLFRCAFHVVSTPHDDLRPGGTFEYRETKDMLIRGYFDPGTILRAHGHLVRVVGRLLSRQRVEITKPKVA